MSNIEVVRVTKELYKDYLDMINWRKTGIRADELRRFGKLKDYTEEELSYGNCLNLNSFFILAAKINGEMVGYVNASIIPKPDKRKGTLFIDEVWTEHSFRGRGIAQTLINYMIELGKEIDIWELRLTVDIDNPAARRVYTKAGFKEKQCIFGRLNPSDL